MYINTFAQCLQKYLYTFYLLLYLWMIIEYKNRACSSSITSLHSPSSFSPSPFFCWSSSPFSSSSFFSPSFFSPFFSSPTLSSSVSSKASSSYNLSPHLFCSWQIVATEKKIKIINVFLNININKTLSILIV